MTGLFTVLNKFSRLCLVSQNFRVRVTLGLAFPEATCSNFVKFGWPEKILIQVFPDLHISLLVLAPEEVGGGHQNSDQRRLPQST
jgi:hypothetical protein